MEQHLRLLEDFELYSRAVIASKDVDPVYSFIGSTVVEFPKFAPHWFCFAYTTFYSLESAMVFCRYFPEPGSFDAKKFKDLRTSKELSKMGHERRGTQRAIDNQILMFQSYINNETAFINKAKKAGQAEFRSFLSRTIPFHGPWATYKVAEVMEKGLDHTNLSIHDLGLDGKDLNSNDGPVGGLRWIFGRENVYSKDWIPVWNKFGGALAKGWGVDIGEVESAICKFHKMKSGNYFVGHDITEFIELEHSWGNAYRKIMSASFHPVFWDGLTRFPKENKAVYQNEGLILNSEFADSLPEIDVADIIIRL